MAERTKVMRGLECCLPDMKTPIDNCGQCPYYADGQTCLSALRRDALALLKEQEARVMTWKDVKGSVGIPVWIEYKQDDGWNGYGVPTSDYGNWMMIFGANAYTAHYDNSYNVKWRVWTSRPTDEQRKAVEWDE